MITKAKIKGALLQFKRAPFTCQKGMFCNAKGHLLQRKRASIDLYCCPVKLK